MKYFALIAIALAIVFSTSLNAAARKKQARVDPEEIVKNMTVQTFVRSFSDIELEKLEIQINQYASKNNLEIVSSAFSSSVYMSGEYPHYDYCAIVVFKKTK